MGLLLLALLRLAEHACDLGISSTIPRLVVGLAGVVDVTDA
ncbi:hypothetical protein [Amycolatopsis minnesotensis]